MAFAFKASLFKQSLVPGVHVPDTSGLPVTSVRDMQLRSFRFMHGAESDAHEHMAASQSSVPAEHCPPEATGLPIGSMRCEQEPPF